MTKKKPATYAFIDSQNLNKGVQSEGWKIDHKKFRLYLKNKYNVTEAYVFMGMIAANQKLYDNIKFAGFNLVFKPTVQYFEEGSPVIKGNVDAELVLHAAAVEYPQYDKAILITGDGDFYCLVQYLQEKGKLLHLMTPTRKYSRLLKEFSEHIVQIQNMKNNVAYKKSRDWRSVETLGLPGHDNTLKIIANPSQKGKIPNLQKKSPGKNEILRGTSSTGDKQTIPSKPQKVNRSRA